MKKTTAFWDASALVPLCVHEAASRHAQSHLRRFAPAVWWGSLVEVHSAICRLHRDKEITDLDKHGAVARLRLLNRGWREILPGDQVRDLATQLLDKHSLRAADSLQLAASLIWCEQVRPGGASSAGTSDWPRPQSQLDSQFSNFQELFPERNITPEFSSACSHLPAGDGSSMLTRVVFFFRRSSRTIRLRDRQR